MIFKPGFITPPWPHTHGDSVSALSLITRIEDSAVHGCGQHYELYHYRALGELNTILAELSASDAVIFKDVAAKRGFHLDVSAVDDSYQAYRVTLAKIRKEQM